MLTTLHTLLLFYTRYFFNYDDALLAIIIITLMLILRCLGDIRLRCLPTTSGSLGSPRAERYYYSILMVLPLAAAIAFIIAASRCYVFRRLLPQSS